MSGALYASGEWTVETMVLDLVPAGHQGGGMLGQAEPDGDGHWLLVKRPGRVFYVRTPAGAEQVMGPDAYASMSRIREW